MKLFTFFTAVLLFAAPAFAQLIDSDFSEWNNDEPVGWDGVRTSIEIYEQVDNDGGFGDFAVRLVREDAQHQRFTTTAVAVEAGVNYEITFWARGSGDVRTGLYDGREDAFGYVYNAYVSPTSEWTQYTQNLLAAETTSQAEFILSVRNTAGDQHIEIDRVVITSADLETVSIYDIQFSTEPDGSSPLVDQTVTTGGIVSAVGAGGFFVQDGSAPWRGIFVFTNQTVNRGDSVIFSGNVVEYFTMTQLSGISGMTILSNNNPVYDPVEISTAEVNTEPYEGVLVRVTDATCTNANSGFGQWVVNDGTGSCLINPEMYEADRTQGLDYNITGPVFYSFSEFKIMPRDMNDVEQVVSVNEQMAAGQLNVFPNPATDVINLRLENGASLTGFIRIFDQAGREVMQLQSDALTGVIDVSALTGGWYTIQHINHDQVSTIRFVKR